MINDIFKVFGEQTAEILFEIVTECMDDYLYIFDLQDNTFEISQSAVNRFNMSESVLTDAVNEVMKVVYEEDRRMLAKHLADICEGREKVHNPVSYTHLRAHETRHISYAVFCLKKKKTFNSLRLRCDIKKMQKRTEPLC